MSSTSNTTSNFQAIFDAALKDYTKKTGKDLCDLDNPLASKLDSCDSPDSILNIFREQAREFGEFRKGDTKLLKWLKPIVKTLHTISTNKVLGDSASRVFPPAMAVFFAIQTLLSAAKDVSKSYDSLVDIFESIENFLIRLNIYIEIPPTQAPAVTEIVTKMMAALITVLALATEQMKQGRLKRYAKKLLGEKEIESVLDRLDRLTREESNMTVAQTYDVVCRLVNKMQVVMEDGEASIDDMRRSLVLMQEIAIQVNKVERDKSQEKFCRWLSATDPWVNQNIARKAHHRGTATWFTEGNVFKKWKSEGSLMWIHGLPGSGKSVLCSSVIQDIQAMCQTGLATLAFFYFDFRDVSKQDARSLLSSLLIQLCLESDKYSEILSSRYSIHGNGTRQPNEEMLIECLKEMLKVPRQGELYIVVDALDECPNFPGCPTPREQVLAILQELVVLRLPHVHFCFTSRPEVDIQKAMGDLAVHNVSLHEQVGQKQDISDYIEFIFSSDRHIQRWKEEDKELAMLTLLIGARGMFRWVFCQVETLRGCFPSSVRRALDDLPETLDGTYEQTLRMINKQKRDYAHRLFQCLVVSKRPLLVEELGELFAIDPNKDTISVYNAQFRPENPEEFILSACSTLVAVVNSSGRKIVQFSHFSVREFLTSHRISISEDVSYFHVLPRPAHTLFARACLGVLLHLDDHTDRDKIQDFPLASYAAEYWVYHAQVDSTSSDLKHEMECIFDKNKPHFTIWLRLYNIDDPTPSFMSSLHRSQAYPTPLYYAALCGFRDIAEHLLNARRQDVNALGGLHRTPLHAALDQGHPSVAMLLLERGADIESRDSRNWTPLHKASYHGYIDVMLSLIVLGADPNAEEDSQETPLYLASKYGRRDAARLLLEHHADANHPDMHGRTPLHVACREGYHQIVGLLLDHGADTNHTTIDGRVPLHAAYQRGHHQIVGLLLDHGADANHPQMHGRTLLHSAYLEGYHQIVALLLDHGADIILPDTDGGTLLHLALREGHDHVISLLLDHGVDVNSSNGDGWTVLHFASWQGYSAVVGSLLDRGADANYSNHLGWAPLHLASQQGHDHVVLLLLDHGVDVNSSNGDGWTALHFASWQGYSAVVRLLLHRGTDANYLDYLSRTSLQLASQQGHDHVVRLLLDHGVDVNFSNGDGWSAIHFASWHGYSAVVRLLLDRGADANCSNNLGWTPLHFASQQGHDHVVQLLLDHGVNLDSSNGDGWTALHFASWHGYSIVIRPLLDRGASYYLDNLSRTPLHLASQQGHEHVVRLLLDHGVDVNPSDSIGWIPLHLASWQGYNHIVVLLLDRGANPNHFDSHCWTSLHFASLEGRPDTVRLLLEHGADPKHQNSHGLAPHHIASQEGYDQIIQLLLDHSADLIHQNNGLASLHVPSWGGHDQIITGIVMPGLHCVLHRGRVITSSSGYYSIRFSPLVQQCVSDDLTPLYLALPESGVESDSSQGLATLA